MKKHEPIPADHPVQPIAPSELRLTRWACVATCGVCGLSWDDGVSTSITPTPAGRCAFEAFHTPRVDPKSDDHVCARDFIYSFAVETGWSEARMLEILGCYIDKHIDRMEDFQSFIDRIARQDITEREG